ncbi:SDR family oxidoreductase [Nocardioides sp. BSK12Z-3]|nr:SDR family oxidoreductase [Nocardioides bruguierae]
MTDANDFLGPGVVERFRAEGEEVVTRAAPFTSRAEVAAFVAEHGPFDVLVANLEVPITVAPVEEHDDATLVGVFDRLVHPLFWVLAACLPGMRAQGDGVVVVPTSAVVLRSSGHPVAAYEAARSAQASVVRSAAKEAAGSGVRVNGVAPNFIENPSYFPPETVEDPSFLAAVRAEVPAQRLGSAAEAAAVVWWLASSESSYVHGAIVPTDGGWRLARRVPARCGRCTAAGRLCKHVVPAVLDWDSRAVTAISLASPEHLTPERTNLLAEVAERNDATHGDDLLGLILSGSAGRGLATERSDLDVYVVLTDDAAAGRRTTKTAAVDEIPLSLSELAEIPPFGTDYWWYRWSFAWAPVVLDRTGGVLDDLALRQATVSPEEARSILVTHDRLDGWVNYAYRALKSDRDGRVRERRLDAAESVPWLLDTVFSLGGRVRPYHKYLPWELEQHPLPGWTADGLLSLVERTLDGDPAAIRETFERVLDHCREFDRSQPEPVLVPIVDGWGSELALFDS